MADELRQAVLDGMKQACGYCRNDNTAYEKEGGTWWHEVACRSPIFPSRNEGFMTEPCKAHWHHKILKASQELREKR